MYHILTHLQLHGLTYMTKTEPRPGKSSAAIVASFPSAAIVASFPSAAIVPSFRRTSKNIQTIGWCEVPLVPGSIINLSRHTMGQRSNETEPHGGVRRYDPFDRTRRSKSVEVGAVFPEA